MEWKVTAVLGFSIPFQKYHFRRCEGLMHWLRWGRMVFDVRPLREYLGLEPETEKYYLYNKCNNAIFEKRIKEITDAVGDRSFFVIGSEVNEFIAKKEAEIIKENIVNGIYDDLPF